VSEILNASAAQNRIMLDKLPPHIVIIFFNDKIREFFSISQSNLDYSPRLNLCQRFSAYSNEFGWQSKQQG
jgi:hypothetical protein